MTTWIWVTIALVLFIAQVIGGLKQVGSPLFWLGRQIMIWFWKRNKQYPLKVRLQKGKTLTIYPHVHLAQGYADSFIIKCPIKLEIRDKQSRREIKAIKLQLSGSDFYKEGAEDFTETKLTGKRLNEIANDTYELSFSILRDDNLKDRYNVNELSDIWGTISFYMGEWNCNARLGIIRKC